MPTEASKNTDPSVAAQKSDHAADHENVRGAELKQQMLESEEKGMRYRAEHAGADARVTMPQKDESSRKDKPKA